MKYKLHAGNRIDRRIVEANDEELRTLGNRVADRIIEVVELYDPDWYKDSSNRPQGYGGMLNSVTNELIGQWLKGEGFVNRRAWGDYWRFVHDKVIGEV